jgi:hypothetical protein
MVVHDSEAASAACLSGMSLASVDCDRRNRTVLAVVIRQKNAALKSFEENPEFLERRGLLSAC